MCPTPDATPALFALLILWFVDLAFWESPLVYQCMDARYLLAHPESIAGVVVFLLAGGM
jgi:hypothetical protein